MTGDELLKLQQSQVFRPRTMDSFINEFIPAPDAFRLTNAFLPFKLVDKNQVQDLIKHGAFGRTHPVNLGAEHKRIALPGYEYRRHSVGHWREAIEFNEGVLQEAVDPANPQELWGAGLQVGALDMLDSRLNNLIEFLTREILINGTYSEARYGIAYTYDPKIPAKFRLDVTSSPPWTSGGTWGTAANATPIADILGAVQKMSDYGFEVTSVWMNNKTLLDFYNAVEVQTLLTSSPTLVENSADMKKLVETLTMLELKKDNRVYREETTLTAASAAADTTLNVESDANFVDGETITLYNSLGEEEEAVISGPPSGNVITVASGVSNAYAIGDRVTVAKKFLPDDYFILETRSNQRTSPNNWISSPSLVKGQNWVTPLPGRYTWTKFQTDVPYKLEIGAGISGGPKVSACNFMRVKTQA